MFKYTKQCDQNTNPVSQSNIDSRVTVMISGSNVTCSDIALLPNHGLFGVYPLTEVEDSSIITNCH